MSNLLNNSEIKKLKQVFLSNISLNRRIAELPNNILSQLVSKIQHSKFNFFTIQVDKMTDIANQAQLCIYARFIHEEHLEDEFLSCESLDTTTAKDI